MGTTSHFEGRAPLTHCCYAFKSTRKRQVYHGRILGVNLCLYSWVLSKVLCRKTASWDLGRGGSEDGRPEEMLMEYMTDTWRSCFQHHGCAKT